MRAPLSWKLRPGGGLLLLAAVVLLSAAFFAWGALRPPLDEVWQLQLELGLGERGPLSKGERTRLEEAMRRHPGLAEAWLDGAASGLVSAHDEGLVECGYAYLLRREPASAGQLELAPAAARARQALQVTVRAGGVEAELRLDGGPVRWRAPDAGPFPQLVELRVHGAPGKKGDRAPPPVLITLAEEAR